MSDFDEFDDEIVAGDFYSLIGAAQHNELVEVEKQRERDRQAMQELEEKQKSAAMTLMQIAGLKSQKEIDQLLAEKNEADVKRVEEEERKRKALENARLTDQFPPPDLSHS